MDDDPLERLLGELLDAHDRGHQPSDQTATPPSAPKRSRRRRSLAAAVAALALSGSAAAAVVIATQKSAPLAGALPELLGSRYALQVEPDLRTGHAGWCIQLAATAPKSAVLPTRQACVPAGRSPLVTSGGIAQISSTTGEVRAWLLYAIVTKQIAALKTPNGARILPISSPDLPDGWRAAITIGTRSRLLTRGDHALAPLNAAGTPVPENSSRAQVLPVTQVNPHAPSGRCRIDPAPASTVRLLKASELRDPLPRSTAISRGLLSCYSVTFSARGAEGIATVLVDARHPGASPGALPGFARLPLDRSVWAQRTLENRGAQLGITPRLFAERFAGGWLIVETAAPMRRATAMLQDLVAQV